MITRRALLEMVGLGCLMAPLLKDLGDPSVERHPSPAAPETVSIPATYLIFINGQGDEERIRLKDFDISAPTLTIAEPLPEGVQEWSMTVELLP